MLTVDDADEAARAVRERPARVDLLLTDVVMPEVNGRELAERLGALAPGHAGPVHVRLLRRGRRTATACSATHAAFLEKPFTERALARKVREVLDLT